MERERARNGSHRSDELIRGIFSPAILEELLDEKRCNIILGTLRSKMSQLDAAETDRFAKRIILVASHTPDHPGWSEERRDGALRILPTILPYGHNTGKLDSASMADTFLKIVKHQDKKQDLFGNTENLEEIGNILSRKMVFQDEARQDLREAERILERTKQQEKLVLYAKQGLRGKELAKKLNKNLYFIKSDLSALAIIRVIEIDDTVPANTLRRSQVRDLVNQNKSNNQIAKELDISVHEVKSDTDWLRKYGLIARRKPGGKFLPEVAANREKVRELAEQGKTTPEILVEFDGAYSATHHYIADIKKEGVKVVGYMEALAQRREQSRVFADEGLLNIQIAIVHNISPQAVKADLKCARKDGWVDTRRKRWKVLWRRERLRKRLIQDESAPLKQLAAELNIPPTTAARDAEWLRKYGLIGERNPKRRRSSEAIKREKQIETLIFAGKSGKEIAETAGVTPFTVYRHIARLEREGKNVPERTRKTQIDVLERREQVYELLEHKRLTVAQTAKELKISTRAVHNHIAALRADGYDVHPWSASDDTAQRRETILKLNRSGVKDKNQLAELMKVNIATIRRDLRALEQQGKVIDIEDERRSRKEKVVSEPTVIFEKAA